MGISLTVATVRQTGGLRLPFKNEGWPEASRSEPLPRWARVGGTIINPVDAKVRLADAGGGQGSGDRYLENSGGEMNTAYL